jgi:very-short-patch-repair endonuclease
MSIQDTNRIRKTLKVVPRDDRGFTPIERSFYDCIVSYARHFPIREVSPTDLNHMERMLELADDGDILFAPAVRWVTWDMRKHYIADFVLMVQGPLRPTICLIECDGHDFHERTQDQALRDKQKDRRAIEIGAKTLRFTGRELSKDATWLVSDVITAVQLEQDERMSLISLLGHMDGFLKLHAYLDCLASDSMTLGRNLLWRVMFRRGNWTARVSQQAVAAVVGDDTSGISRCIQGLRDVFAYQGIDDHGRMVFRLRMERWQ